MIRDLLRIFSSTLIILLLTASNAASAQETVQQIKQKIIEDSIEGYEGNCPCPYNLTRNGKRCGKRSAYSRASGESPLCFEEDVTDEMIQQYKHNLN